MNTRLYERIGVLHFTAYSTNVYNALYPNIISLDTERKKRRRRDEEVLLLLAA